jgi:uncharacterized protein YcnI
MRNIMLRRLNLSGTAPELPGVRLIRIPRRACVLAAAVAAGVLCAAAPAAADVTVSPSAAPQGAGSNLTFAVKNTHTAAMTGIRLVLPAATPVAEVYPLSVPDWAPRITTRTLNPPMQSMHGGSPVTEATATIEWTAAAGKAVPPGGSAEVMVAIGPLPQTDTMSFEVQATYADGSTGPAIAPVVLNLTPVAGVEEPAGEDIAAEGAATDGGGGSWAVAGWLVALVIGAVAVAVMVRSRRAGGSSRTPAARTQPARTQPGGATPPATTTTGDEPGGADPEEGAAAPAWAAPNEAKVAVPDEPVADEPATNDPADTTHRARVTAWSYRDGP